MFSRFLVLTLVVCLSFPVAPGRAEPSATGSDNRPKNLAERIEEMRAQTAEFEAEENAPEQVELTGGLLDSEWLTGKRRSTQTKAAPITKGFTASRSSDSDSRSNTSNVAPRFNPTSSRSSESERSPSYVSSRKASSSSNTPSGSFQQRMENLRESLGGPQEAVDRTAESVRAPAEATSPKISTERVASRPISARPIDTITREEPESAKDETAAANVGVSSSIAAEDEFDTPVRRPQQIAPVVRPRESQQSNVLMTLAGPQLSAMANGPKRIVVGRQAEYKVIVRNSGEVAADDVVVTVQLPPWVEIVNSNPTRGMAKADEAESLAHKIEWKLDRLGAGGSESVALQVIPRESKPVNLGVRWDYRQTASETQVVVEEPLLHMVISGPGEANYGETKLYNLTLSNPGTGDAENVVISLLPLGGSHEGRVTHAVGLLKKGETKTIQVELSAGKAGTLVVKAGAVAEGGLHAEAVKEVLVRRADLKVAIVGERAQYAGNPGLFRIRVSNPGNATAEDVVVEADLPAGAEFASASHDGSFNKEQGTITWNLGSIAASGDRILEFTSVLRAAGANEVHVTSREATDLVADAMAATMVIARADLKLVISDPKGPVPVGETAEYEVRIINRGTKDAENVEAVAYFSEGIEPIAVTGGSFEISPGQVLLHGPPSIAAGDELVYRIQAKADQAGDHVFRAEVICRSLGTKHAAEETTHFYNSELSGLDFDSRPTAAVAESNADAGEPIEVAERLEESADEEPRPLDEQPADAEPAQF
ncbi:MAG: DUF11 domain-containing protein [Planctomycetales bacterium]|nr:DUF11 domain-containing protein [Planctomycetales bacterium]